MVPSLLRIVTTPRSARWVIGAWVAVVGACAPLALGLGGEQQTDQVNYLPTNAQSAAMLREMATRPGGERSTAVLVYVRSGAALGTADRARIDAARERVTDLVDSAEPPSPVRVAADGHAALFSVSLPDKDKILNRALPQLRSLVHDSATDENLRVAVTGAAGYTADANAAASGVDGALLGAAAAVVVVLLLVIYRSPVLWLLPLATTAGGLFVAQAAITLFARGDVLTVTDLAGGILNVLVFGAATDYALLLIARYRERLRAGAEPQAALQLALRSASPAIVASGATVIGAMLCLLAGTIGATRGLGPVAALGIAGSLLASLTLLPALLAVTGRRAFWPRVPVQGNAPAAGWTALAGVVGRRAGLLAVASTVLLGLGALGLLSTHLGLSQAEAYRGTPDSVVGAGLLDEHFPPGANAPAEILVDAVTANRSAKVLAGTPGVTDVAASEQFRSRTLLTATLRHAPDSAAAESTVQHIRARLARTNDTHALVGGVTAVRLDIADGAAHDRRTVMPLALGAVLIVLLLLLRSAIRTALVLATVALSYLAAVGVSAVLFHALGLAGIDASVPMYVFVFLIALGADYNIFLMTRIREESRCGDVRSATLRALALTGGVITSAGVVLAATFTTLAVLPLAVLTETGLAVAVGVLIDTFLVRCVLVPALLVLLERGRVSSERVRSSQ